MIPIIIIYISTTLINNIEKKKINMILDNLHKYASEANGKMYFDLFNEDAVFFGTDASERWTINKFKDYAQKRFDNGDGWTYYSIERNIFLNENNNTAWFDEILKNEKYGLFRGTGVLTKKKEIWKIDQYNLLLPIPNELLIRYSQEIKKFLNKELAYNY